MKNLLFLFFTALFALSACKQTEKAVRATPKNYVNEVSYIIERTNTNEVQEVTSTGVTAVFSHSAYPVLNKPGERDILFGLYPEVPADVDIVSRFSFSILMSVPEDILHIPESTLLSAVALVTPEDYPQLLLDDDDENGRRVCLTKEDQSPNGTVILDNACASEGWYGEDGDFSLAFTHHELFYDDENHPNVYAQGTFSAETGTINGGEGAFKLSNGKFKVVIPLSLE